MTRNLFATALLAAATITAIAQTEGPTPTQALVTASSKAPTVLTIDQVSARVNNHETPLSSLTPVAPNGLQVALLIDDGLRASAGTQLNELRDFILHLRPGTEMFVGYMQNGHVVGPSNFSTDYASLAREIRLPLGNAGINASPYFCLTDFLKRWPGAPEGRDDEPASTSGKARVVLMITNGVDPYNGSVSIRNQNSPYVAEAATVAQRAGVPVYSIYYGDAGMRGNQASLSGQSYLQQIADATGGQTLFEGTWSPVSIAPFLGQFQRALSETYLATFPAPARGAKTLVPLKLSTKLPGTKLHAPTEVHPGMAVMTSGPGGTLSSASMQR